MNYNTVLNTKPNASSAEGGDVYLKKPIDYWLNHLFSSFNEDGYYESQAIQEKRYLQVTEQIANAYGYEFVAKAAMFARNELGMRSISQLTAAWLSNKQFEGKRAFYRNYCHRPDDVNEIFAAAAHLNIPRNHSMCRGFGDYLSTLGDYDLTKYKQKGHEYNMYDVINLTHPCSDSIDKFMRGAIKSADTWEVNVSTAKSVVEKEQVWREMVENHKLGYIALLRNLNNILDCRFISNEWIRLNIIPQLTDIKAIKKSLVFPYQIYNAYKNLKIHNSLIIMALETAFRISVKNMPKLPGLTAVILDVSGSMKYPVSSKSNITLKEIGAVYAAAIALQNENIHIIKFATYAKVYHFNPLDNIFYQIKYMYDNEDLECGTCISAAYEHMNIKCDRIFLISDMQIMDRRENYWPGDSQGIQCYSNYCNQYGNIPIYSFDLGNYHTQTDNPNNPYVHLCTSLSDKVFQFISLL